MQGSEQATPQLDQGLRRRDTCLYVLIPPLHAALHTVELSRKEGNVELLFETLHCSEDTEQNSSPRTS